MRKKISKRCIAALLLAAVAMTFPGCRQPGDALETLRQGFAAPPDSVRPGVYWYFMDGNLSAAGVRKDLVAMKEAGIGKAVFLEVNVGVPQGPVDFLSPQWFDIFRYIVREADSLSIALTLGVGPGWAGSGGPWITPAQSMQQLVASAVEVTGPGLQEVSLPVPEPKKPYFGIGTLTPSLRKQWEDYSHDVAVLAFPAPDAFQPPADIDEKALYYRAPFSSRAGVKPRLRSFPEDTTFSLAGIPRSQVIDLTGELSQDGRLRWQVPSGKWTVMRFVARTTGALTRPAPAQGLGFESSKFDTAAVRWQLQSYVGRILDSIGGVQPGRPGGLKMLHLDSWEMGAQNWSRDFRQAFIRLRGYDPLPFYPAYAGYVVGSQAATERFLWDLRQTASELVIDRYARYLRQYAHEHHLGFSIEPYDMNPSADLDLGAVGDVPMGEFWSRGYGFNTAFSCIEAASIAHIMGRPVVQAEAFTGSNREAWNQYPGSMKDQGDWAFAAGINQFYYHTFAHKPFADSLVPGMTMGPYGVHWDRKQTWWPMVGAYHQYVARCQYLLQQGSTIADILYLTPEGAPEVLQPPPSAMAGDPVMPDRRGFNFDGCSAAQLMTAGVRDHRIVFPGGASYRLLVLPGVRTMTPALAAKIDSLVSAGAAMIGAPPLASPSLSGYPASDSIVQQIASRVWGSLEAPRQMRSRSHGKGRIFWGGGLASSRDTLLYPDYGLTAEVLHGLGATEDFTTRMPLRYTHRHTDSYDLYFVSNRTGSRVSGEADFRVAGGTPECWDPVTGSTRPLSRFRVQGGHTRVPLVLEPYQSFFIVFPAAGSARADGRPNFSSPFPLDTLTGSWELQFDPQLGGPGRVVFDSLGDWTMRPEDGIRYYSGIARYRKVFDAPAGADTVSQMFLNLGVVKDLAQVRLNGKDLGVVWTAPYQVDITGLLKEKGNVVEIAVANRWPNRLIGDARLPDDGIREHRWPSWLLRGEKRSAGRVTFTTYDPYTTDSPLLPSGLLGPVRLLGAAGL